MNEVISALIGFCGVILGIAIQEFRRWRERKEMYHSMIFKERLERHQKAFELCHKLNRVLNTNDSDEIHKVAKEFREWWDKNCFYLDKKSRELIVPLINYAHTYANKRESGEKVWNILTETLKSLQKGIGVNYLPEDVKSGKND